MSANPYCCTWELYTSITYKQKLLQQQMETDQLPHVWMMRREFWNDAHSSVSSTPGLESSLHFSDMLTRTRSNSTTYFLK